MRSSLPCFPLYSSFPWQQRDMDNIFAPWLPTDLMAYSASLSPKVCVVAARAGNGARRAVAGPLTGAIAVPAGALDGDVFRRHLAEREIREGGHFALHEQGAALTLERIDPERSGAVPAPAEQSSDTSTPCPPVISRMRASGSSFVTSMTWSAPSTLAISRRLASFAVPVTMIRSAPACLQATICDRPCCPGPWMSTFEA